VECACEQATLVLYVSWRAKELGPMTDTGLAAEKFAFDLELVAGVNSDLI
jgi:hypothetical protein